MTWFFYAIISSFFASLETIVEKKLLEKQHATTFSTALALVAALSTLPFIFIYSVPLSIQTFALIYVASILATIGFLEVTRGIRHLEISNAAPLFLLSPLITALLAYAFLGEALTTLQILGILILAFGAYILQTSHLRDVREFWSHVSGNIYIRLIMLGLLMYGFTSLIDRIVLHSYGLPPLLYIAYLQIAIAFNFVMLQILTRKGLVPTFTVFKENGKGIILVALLTTGYRVAQSLATALAYIGLVIAIKRSSSLFTTIIGGEIFHEDHLLRKTIACIVMIIGVICISIQ